MSAASPSGWGLSIFAANSAAWNTLPPDLRDVIKQGIGSLEQRIWDAADHETTLGLACDTGAASCTSGHPSHMILVPVSAQDEATRKRLLTETVIPDWVAALRQRVRQSLEPGRLVRPLGITRRPSLSANGLSRPRKA